MKRKNNQIIIFFICVDLQANSLDLEVRVGNLEESSGGVGNTTDLELRVDELEDVTTDLDTRVMVAEENIQGKAGLPVAELETSERGGGQET